MQEKCKFSICTVKFLGHKVSKDGIKADPDKTSVHPCMLSFKLKEICANYMLWVQRKG